MLPQFLAKTVSPCIEALEPRIAPASLITYTDSDGDIVRVISSKGVLTGHATFDHPEAARHQLQTLDLTDHSFAGTNLLVSVTKAVGGDGQANVGFINAAGNDLGIVVVNGDLGRIEAGTGNAAKFAVARLSVKSMGAFGTSTQEGGTPLPTVPGATAGDLATLLGSPSSGNSGTLGQLLTDAENLLGTSGLTADARRLLADLVSDGQALLSTVGTGPISQITDGTGHLLENLLRNVEDLAGLTQHSPGSFGGSLSSHLTGLLQNVGDLVESVVGDLGLSPVIDPHGLVSVPPIIGSGGTLVTVNLGQINQLQGHIDGLSSTLLSQLPSTVSTLFSNLGTTLDNLLGGILGGGNSHINLPAGVLQNLSQLESSLASLLGNSNSGGGNMTPGAMDQMQQIAGDIISLLGSNNTAGTGSAPALVTSNLNGGVGVLAVQNNLDGVFLNVQGNIVQAVVGGSLIGGSDPNTGEIFASGSIGRLGIRNNVIGGDDLNTGLIHANGKVGVVGIGGSLIGGDGTNSGSLSFHGDAALVSIGGDLNGGAGHFSGSVVNSNGSLGYLLVRGSVITGDQGGEVSVSVSDRLGLFRVGKGLLGDADHRVGIAAGGLHSQTGVVNYAFGTVAIYGAVNHADILAGYDSSTAPINGTAGIDYVGVVGNLAASNIVAGVRDGNGGGFGDADDRRIATGSNDIIGRISAIFVRGGVNGTAAAGDHYGFVAAQIGRVVVNTSILPMTPGAGSDVVPLSADSGDVTVREVTAAN